MFKVNVMFIIYITKVQSFYQICKFLSNYFYQNRKFLHTKIPSSSHLGEGILQNLKTMEHFISGFAFDTY